MMTPHFKAVLPMLLVALLMIGCAATPQNQREGVTVTGTAIETLADTVVTLRDDGYISQEQALDLKARLQSANDMLQAAKDAIADGHPDRGDDLLGQADHILDVVRSTLEATR